MKQVDNPSPEAEAAASRRWDAIDLARGLAVAAMVAYHFTWDLSFLNLIATNIVVVPAWQWFARAIAGSFLALVGVGLALAHARGLRKGAFLRRLTRIGAAAVAITLVTYFAFPDRFIFFGILHCIAVSSVLALAFLDAPLAIVGAAALFCVAAPLFFDSPIFDAPWLDWLGLGQSSPRTNDYVPIFPWFGAVLLGLIVGRLLLQSDAGTRLSQWRASNRPTRWLATAGRWSLPVYLLHQPVMLAVLYGVLRMTGPHPEADARPFRAQCEAQCVKSNGEASLCRWTCNCLVDLLKRDGVWEEALADRLNPNSQAGYVRQCISRPRPAP